MLQSNSKTIKLNQNINIKPGWYKASFVHYVEKQVQNIAYSYLEFQLKDSNNRIQAILPIQNNSMPKIKRLKQALGMSENESDFKQYLKKHLQVYIDHANNDDNAEIEVKDFANYQADVPDNNGEGTARIPKQILIVDDQKELASLIGNYVEHLGFIPVVVTSVSEALIDFNPDKYLMIISDIIMPGQSGFDLVRYMHNNHPEVPVALMSGYFDKEMQNLQKVFGIDKIYRKPVFINAVKEMIFNALKKMAAKNAE